MNQILITKEMPNNLEVNLIYDTKKQAKKKIIIFQFLLCIIIFSFTCGYSVYSYNMIKKRNKISDKLIENFSILSLYSDNSNYTASKLSLDNYVISEDKINVIGLIEIPKLNITYPILSNVNDNLLKISVCRFYGPMPNEFGNLCIAGHNYNNNSFFSKINSLQFDDKVYIYDLSGNKLEYNIYSKFEVDAYNTDCTSQNMQIKEVTLITCNNLNDTKRIVIKAKLN